MDEGRAVWGAIRLSASSSEEFGHSSNFSRLRNYGRTGQNGAGPHAVTGINTNAGDGCTLARCTVDGMSNPSIHYDGDGNMTCITTAKSCDTRAGRAYGWTSFDMVSGAGPGSNVTDATLSYTPEHSRGALTTGGATMYYLNNPAGADMEELVKNGISATSFSDFESVLADRALPLPRNRANITRLHRYAAVGLIVLIHSALFWMMAMAIRVGISVSVGAGRSTELNVRVIGPNLASGGIPAPSTDWDFLTPDEVLVPEPEIDIVPEQQIPGGAGVTVMRQKLPPRLDPAHVNQRPELPARLGSFVTALALELRILVLPDGSVGDAEVVRSTGQREIDAIAIGTVKNSWRYIPATINGKPIESWTTVIVRFAAI